MASEIERAIEESASRSANKKARIDSWNESIANKRAEIREANEQINKANERLDVLDDLDEKLQKIEKKKRTLNLLMKRLKSYVMATVFSLIMTMLLSIIACKHGFKNQMNNWKIARRRRKRLNQVEVSIQTT